jgi:hypothetical protein
VPLGVADTCPPLTRAPTRLGVDDTHPLEEEILFKALHCSKGSKTLRCAGVQAVLDIEIGSCTASTSSHGLYCV